MVIINPLGHFACPARGLLCSNFRLELAKMLSTQQRIERTVEQLRDVLGRDPAAVVSIHHTGEEGGVTSLNLPEIPADEWPLNDPRGPIPIPPRAAISIAG